MQKDEGRKVKIESLNREKAITLQPSWLKRRQTANLLSFLFCTVHTNIRSSDDVPSFPSSFSSSSSPHFPAIKKIPRARTKRKRPKSHARGKKNSFFVLADRQNHHRARNRETSVAKPRGNIYLLNFDLRATVVCVRFLVFIFVPFPPIDLLLQRRAGDRYDSNLILIVFFHLFSWPSGQVPGVASKNERTTVLGSYMMTNSFFPHSGSPGKKAEKCLSFPPPSVVSSSRYVRSGLRRQ